MNRFKRVCCLTGLVLPWATGWAADVTAKRFAARDFPSVIGTAPESILNTTIDLTGDWKQWKASGYEQVLTPETKYECPELPNTPSEVGEIYGPAKQLRDPALYVEGGKVFLFYTVCGEQGIGAAEVSMDSK